MINKISIFLKTCLICFLSEIICSDILTQYLIAFTNNHLWRHQVFCYMFYNLHNIMNKITMTAGNLFIQTSIKCHAGWAYMATNLCNLLKNLGLCGWQQSATGGINVRWAHPRDSGACLQTVRPHSQHWDLIPVYSQNKDLAPYEIYYQNKDLQFVICSQSKDPLLYVAQIRAF